MDGKDMSGRRSHNESCDRAGLGHCILFSSMIVRRLLSTVRPGFSLSPTIRQLLDSRPETERIVTVCGWIKSVRRQKNVAFAAITDGSDAKGIQAVLLKGIDDEILRRS